MTSRKPAGLRAVGRRLLAASGLPLGRLSPERGAAPVALVYRGPASLPGCPEAVAKLLESSRWGFEVRYVGPDGAVSLSPQILAGAALYVQPGGGTLEHAYRHMRRHRDAIRHFVRSGGSYLGLCLGGYLAGATPGFGLLPGDTDQYVASPGATLTSTDDALVDVRWRGRQRTLFFQDGPYFWLQPGTAASIVATYPNDTIAALVAGFGSGRVAVVGPHPEATEDWFIDAGLALPDRLGTDLGLDLLDEVMTP